MIMATITHEQVATSTCKESTERFCAIFSQKFSDLFIRDLFHWQWTSLKTARTSEEGRPDIFKIFFSCFWTVQWTVKKTNSKFILESFTAEDKSVKSVLNNFINSGKSARWKPGPRKNKGNSAKTAPESTEESETVVKW